MDRVQRRLLRDSSSSHVSNIAEGTHVVDTMMPSPTILHVDYHVCIIYFRGKHF